MKVVKPGTPLPPGIREKLESIPPERGGRSHSTRPSAHVQTTKPSSARPGQQRRSSTGTRAAAVLKTTPPPMAARSPSRPPPGPPTGFASHGLDEVERALSVLDGRHPDAERVEREVRAEREWRQGQLAVEAREAIRKRRVRRALQVVFFLVSLVVAGLGFTALERYRQADEQMALLAQKYTSQGFVAWVSPSWPRGARLEATLDQPACLVALGTGSNAGVEGAAARPASLRVERGGDRPGAPAVDEVPAAAAWCGCRGEHVVVSELATELPMTRLLRIDPHAVGEHAGLDFLDPQPDRVLSSRSQDCEVGGFGNWLNEGHPAPRSRAAYDAWSSRTELESAGFVYLATALPTDALLPLHASNERCTLVRSDAEDDTLSLRFGGEDPVQLRGTGALLWCATSFPASTVARAGKGTVFAMDVDAARIGGGLGLAEWTLRAHVLPPRADVIATLAVPWVRPGDLGWDARNALVASGAPDSVVTAGDGAAQRVGDARLTSIALAEGGAVRAESEATSGDDGDPSKAANEDGDGPGKAPSAVAASPAPYACIPAFGGRRSVCEQAGPLTWSIVGDPSRAAIAQAKLPFWLAAMNGVATARAQQAAASLLAFARRVHPLGYEATSSDRIVELPRGVQIRGASGSDEVIAVGVGDQEPFIIPYTDAPPWTLDGTPRAVPVAPGQMVKLQSATGQDLPPSNRRTVVFRHQPIH